MSADVEIAGFQTRYSTRSDSERPPALEPDAFISWSGESESKWTIANHRAFEGSGGKAQSWHVGSCYDVRACCGCRWTSGTRRGPGGHEPAGIDERVSVLGLEARDQAYGFTRSGCDRHRGR